MTHQSFHTWVPLTLFTFLQFFKEFGSGGKVAWLAEMINSLLWQKKNK